MRTLHLRLERPASEDAFTVWKPSLADSSVLDQAAAILRAGGTVAMPTETVYGLAANALDSVAIEKIFLAKQRPHWDPLIVHVADASMTGQITAKIPPAAQCLIDTYWPGPLTLLLPRSTRIPDAVTAGRPLVGVRMPRHPVALELIRRAGLPLAAPSANLFGHISPTTAEHVLSDLDGRIDAVLDAGPTACGVESTVLDPTQPQPTIYRPGAICAEQLAATLTPLGLTVRAWNPATFVSEPREALPSPGVGLRHYAPRARLVLVPAETDAMSHALGNLPVEAFPVGLLLPRNFPASASPDAWQRGNAAIHVFPWGDWLNPDSLAASLYAGLRQLDAAGCVTILAPVPAATGIGAAIQDRLRKAATPSADAADKSSEDSCAALS